MSFFSPASQTNLATESWNPSPRMRSFPFWPSSLMETNKPPSAIVIPASKPFSITSKTQSIPTFKIRVTHPFWEKYSKTAKHPHGLFSKRSWSMKSFSKRPSHAIVSCSNQWPVAACGSARFWKSGPLTSRTARSRCRIRKAVRNLKWYLSLKKWLTG